VRCGLARCRKAVSHPGSRLKWTISRHTVRTVRIHYGSEGRTSSSQAPTRPATLLGHVRDGGMATRLDVRASVAQGLGREQPCGLHSVTTICPRMSHCGVGAGSGYMAREYASRNASLEVSRVGEPGRCRIAPLLDQRVGASRRRALPLKAAPSVRPWTRLITNRAASFGT
jgi:hypothetical protein